MNKPDIQKNKIKWNNDAKFTKIRNPYKKYNKAEWNWEDIFCEIEVLKKSESKIFKTVSLKYGINYKTLKNKYYKFKNDKKYNDFDAKNRGKNKIFTDDQEDEIFIFIKENFIDKHRILCNEIIKEHALEKFNTIYKNTNKKFTASNGWINTFKKRYNLSTVKTSISKIATIKYTEEEINDFIKKCKKSLVKVGANFFLI